MRDIWSLNTQTLKPPSPRLDRHLDWTSRRNPYTSIRMAKMTYTDVPICWQGFGEMGLFLHHWWEQKWCRHSGKECDMHLPYSPTPECLHKRNENLYKRPYINIHSSFISNSLNQESSQMSLTGRLDNKTVVHPYHGILLSNRRGHILYVQLEWI